MGLLQKDGFEIHRAVFSAKEIAALRMEVTRLQVESDTACIRDIITKSELLDQFTSNLKLTSLIPEDMSPVRSILFDKTPEENWPVLWHQDLTIAIRQKEEVNAYGPWSIKNNIPHVQPPLDLLQNMVTIRIHLDDTREENGALIVIPKTHLLGKIPPNEIREHLNDQSVICECTAGDVLLMSPLLVHSSRRAAKPGNRRIVHLEYARRSHLEYPLEWAARKA